MLTQIKNFDLMKKAYDAIVEVLKVTRPIRLQDAIAKIVSEDELLYDYLVGQKKKEGMKLGILLTGDSRIKTIKDTDEDLILLWVQKE